jgi:hypothetical protein
LEQLPLQHSVPCWQGAFGGEHAWQKPVTHLDPGQQPLPHACGGVEHAPPSEPPPSGGQHCGAFTWQLSTQGPEHPLTMQHMLVCGSHSPEVQLQGTSWPQPLFTLTLHELPQLLTGTHWHCVATH